MNDEEIPGRSRNSLTRSRRLSTGGELLVFVIPIALAFAGIDSRVTAVVCFAAPAVWMVIRKGTGFVAGFFFCIAVSIWAIRMPPLAIPGVLILYVLLYGSLFLLIMSADRLRKNLDKLHDGRRKMFETEENVKGK